MISEFINMLTEIAPKRRRRKVKESQQPAIGMSLVKSVGEPDHQVRVYRETAAPNRYIIKLFNNDIESKRKKHEKDI